MCFMTKKQRDGYWSEIAQEWFTYENVQRIKDGKMIGLDKMKKIADNKPKKTIRSDKEYLAIGGS